jgi:hypothetical protein
MIRSTKAHTLVQKKHNAQKRNKTLSLHTKLILSLEHILLISKVFPCIQSVCLKGLENITVFTNTIFFKEKDHNSYRKTNRKMSHLKEQNKVPEIIPEKRL